MKKIINIFSLIIIGFSIIFFFHKFIKYLPETSILIINFHSIMAMIAVIGLNMLIIVLNTYIWIILIKGGKIILPFKLAYTVFGQSQIGKYIPGKVFAYVNRIAIGKLYKISGEATLFSTSIEAIISIVTCFLIGALGLIFNARVYNIDKWIVYFRQDSFTDKIIIVVCILAILAIIILPIIFIFPKITLWIRQRLSYLNIVRIISSILIYSVMLGIHGLTMSILLKYYFNVDTVFAWYTFVSGYAIAWVIGFMVPGAPGGIGVREAVLLAIFGGSLGEGVTISLVIILRILTCIGDFITFTISYFIQRSLKKENLNADIT